MMMAALFYSLRKEPNFDEVFSNGQDVVDGSEKGQERDSLNDKLEDLRTRWDELKKKSNERKEVLEEIVPLAKKYDESRKELLPWLDEAEKKLDNLEVVSADQSNLNKQDEIAKVRIICLTLFWTGSGRTLYWTGGQKSPPPG